MVKRSGPITDPWGTPHSSRWWRETTSPILIASVLSDRYEVSHASGDPPIPIEYNWRSSILWSTVSKAAVRFRRTSIIHFLRSSACNMSSWMLMRSVSVLWRGRYVLWNGSRTYSRRCSNGGLPRYAFLATLTQSSDLKSADKFTSSFESRVVFFSTGVMRALFIMRWNRCWF